MIFVTVGTHEQPFNRLIKYVDNLKKNGVISDKVIMQIGYSTYKPQYCTWERLYSYQEMLQLVKESKIVITHGGPSSFIMPLQFGKVPIVVPRKHEFNEHINNHQVSFSKTLAERMKTIIVVEEIEELKNVLRKYDSIISEMATGLKSNNAEFNKELEKIVNQLFDR